MSINGLILDENGYIKIPDHINKIRFDIGLSYSAPNSAVWLKENKDIFVVGVEPNKYCVNAIKNNGLSCMKKNIRIFYPNERFMLLNCALDNVPELIKKPFYHMDGDPGTSSLLKPTSELKYNVKEVSEIDTIPFSYLLKLIPYNRFNHIELVKTDTQGKDLDIIKSTGDYLNKIVFLNSEINTFNFYHDNNKPNDFNEFMQTNNFMKILDNSIVRGEVVDSTYLNKNYLDIKDSINYFVL